MKKITLLITAIIISLFSFSQENSYINHNLHVIINPETSEINVTDSITINGDYNKEFMLNANLIPTGNSKNISLKKISDNTKSLDVGMDRDAPTEEDNLKTTTWRIKGSAKNFVISYKGKIKTETKQSKENYQRGFAQTSGIICYKGTYLAGSTVWIPMFKDKLITFSLTTELPKDWRNVSQGTRTKDITLSDKHIDTWICDKPQEEIFLIAAKFAEYSHDMNGGIKVMAFLRTPDEGLANKYLETTEQYMEMHQSTLGKYPYSKFALVENFWETGYGMPSFTLLGEKIIRFPFILHSSYPHELLHNWWGNSVYVDFKNGNWCEGTTVFMADHLIKEQRGQGEEYRRSTLQKFSNLVNKDNDFPLNKFISRHDGPSEAIGYGKAMFMWQMLRRKLGDEMFIKGMRLFYENNKFRAASYSDINDAMEEVSGLDLKPFFDQWTNRIGAPELIITDIKKDMFAGKYRIHIKIKQNQDEDIFNIDIPINIATEKGVESFVFNMNKREQEYQISLKNKPLKLVVDAQYDIFRILNPNEAPPTLSKIWGSDNNIIILPSKTDKKHTEIYKTFAEEWKAVDNDNFIIKYDKDINELPTDKTAWILGFGNKFAPKIGKQLSAYNVKFNADSIHLTNKKIVKEGNDFVFTMLNPTDINKQNIFICIDNKKAIAGLIRKLPHYGKYSYLAFTNNEPTNIAKGQWPVLNSPLVKVFDKEAQQLSVKEPREPLATLKPIFSEHRMMGIIKYLASEEMKGRGLGTPELDQAAEYIAQKFKAAGLQPINGTYFQKFTHNFKEKGVLNLTNVIGIIPGTDPDFKDNPVVVSAHYDHLGFGWPDVRKGNKGKIHYGADDNASGIATIIELANTMAKTVKPTRTIVFIATTGEEAGLIGSRYFVKHSKDYFSGDFFANVNIDTDGSLFDKKLMVLNANTAKEWKFIFMGTDYTTGVKTQVIEKELDASDQFAFIEKGIPAIQLFTGATENYHRPTDTFDKIDSKGLVKVATVAKEVLTYLADRKDAMPYTGKNHSASATKTKKNKKSRRVSTGSVPDFAFRGAGIRVGSVIKGSTGEEAGLQAGDIITEINGDKIEDLKQYSDYLKKFKPQDIITLTIVRNEKKQNIELELDER
ncbi:MAG: M20/M25/M40 family metallo-hydrolase [Bacteroidota bacterium]|nr:M20/M25/M40 family metallo-hydrolase [Bacteroidota bacterium]